MPIERDKCAHPTKTCLPNNARSNNDSDLYTSKTSYVMTCVRLQHGGHVLRAWACRCGRETAIAAGSRCGRETVIAAGYRYCKETRSFQQAVDAVKKCNHLIFATRVGQPATKYAHQHQPTWVRPASPRRKITPFTVFRETTLHDRIVHSINYHSLFPFTL